MKRNKYGLFDAKRGKGTFKGYIGECLFKLTDDFVILTRFMNRHKYVKYFGKFLSEDKLAFLMNNWYTIDAVKILWDVDEKRVSGIMLYEIKSRNKYRNIPSNWLNTFTQEQVNVYNAALRVGFQVQVVTVWLWDNWQFGVEFCNFGCAKYYVSKPARYDKLVSS